MPNRDSRALAEAGPAFDQVRHMGPIDWAVWLHAADEVTRALAGAPDLGVRVHHLYLPVLFWCANLARASTRRPVVIGLQAPQGAGKTTLGKYVLDLLPRLGLRGVSVSIDDFYLPRADQVALASAHPGNPYLEHRGYPGTHDIALGESTIAALRSINERGRARVPVYDKSQHNGRGDRTPESAWREIAAPVDIVIVEGWMLGFEPVAESTIDDPHLAVANRALADYGRWHRLIDAFIMLRAEDDAFVLKWRVEAEEKMKEEGKPGLARADIEDYVRRFLPAYALWAGRTPASIPADRTLTIRLDGDRRPS